MVKVTRTFTAGKMNKVVDERLLPAGEYVDAQNMRLGSTEDSEIGSIELARGNTQISTITFNDTAPSAGARCIGALEDNANNRIYWFINDPTWVGNGGGSPVTTTILDMVVSMDTNTGETSYHLVSVQEGTAGRSTLNFNMQYLITGVNLVDDLLFWTDNLNPPRCINVNQGYPPPTLSAGVVTTTDNFSAEEIRVIVRPPTNAPTVSTSVGAEQFNFLKERFISFGYRYKYESGEYSATSQFSKPAFIPNNFQFSPQSFLNEGMTNRHNVATITCNSGSELVKSVELLWKDNDNGIIKVMERIKKDGAIPDNTDITRSFNTSKILTVLPDSEILRLYDNVPRWAKAQTLMGNRLVYGNYIENYDLKVEDEDDAAMTNVCYETSLVASEIGEQFLDSTSGTGLYNFGGPSVSLPNSVLNIDMSDVSTSLSAGSIITISLAFQVGYVPFVDYFQLGGGVALNPAPINSVAAISSVPEQFSIDIEYVLPESYTGIAALVASSNFQAVIGATTANPIATACGGYTWTDIFNCNIPIAYNTSITPLVDPYNLYPVEFGINAGGDGVAATSTSDNLFLQFPAVRYCQTPGDSVNDATSYNMYFRIIDSTVGFATSGSPPSLHSNRGYEVGIVYMDAFKRATTAFTSLNNVVHVGCTNSYLRNQIQVTIPPQQVAPWWAQTYKFVVKPSETSYETIFGNIVFRKPGEADAYILLEGENMRKVEEGTRLIVKSDMSGPVEGCNYITVLEKKAQEKDFIIVPLDPEDPDGPQFGAPSGVYIKIKASGVDLTVPPDSITTTGWKSKTKSGGSSSSGPYPVIKLGPAAFNVQDETMVSGWGAPLALPAGSRVRMKFKFTRKGKWGGGGYCERRKYKWEPDDFFVGDDYESVIDWFNAENIKEIIEANNGSAEVGNEDACDIDNYVYTTTTDDDDELNGWGNECVNGYQWYQSTDADSLDNIRFLVRGTHACGTVDKAKSKVEGEITIFRATSLLIFETLPTNALPDVWYEGADNYAIDNGNHLSGTEAGDVNQDIATGVSGQVLLSNFNCYTFGNGCESYTIRDSVEGDSISLGNRVTATASQDYGRAHRFADLTYSGVYNDFSNINKLNEFNLGLLNFKPLEDSFGVVQKLVGRKSDILVLQEDKISYVLAGKNLLSDSTGGGAVTATPTVLGTQIARLEEYGIGNSPESYAEYGYDKFFTDEKRGAVVKLTGGSHSTESLEVVSEYGMRSWFRDMFIAEHNDFKLGGYDPYMNEYVLNTTDIQHPVIVPCVPCNTYQEVASGSAQTWIFCVELGNSVGTVTITTSFLAIISVTYNGVTTSGAGVTTLVFDKGSQNPTTAVVNVIGLTTGPFGITVGCVVPVPMQVRRVVINSPQYGLPESEFVHNQMQWTDGTFTSDLYPDNSSTSTSLLSMPESLTGNCNRFVTSFCDLYEGNQGEGPVPTDAATVTVISNTLNADDNFVFDPAVHRLGVYRGSTLLSQDCNDYANVISIVNSATFGALNPEQVTALGTVNSATIPMPASLGLPGTDILWIIYDYREVKEIELCHVASVAEDVSLYSETCCDCNCPTGQNTTYQLYTNAQQVDGSYITYAYYNAAGNLINQALIPGSTYEICVSGTVSPLFPIVLNGYETQVDISIIACNCT